MSDRLLHTGQTEDTEMIATARQLALWLHRDQVDKQGGVYFGHLSRVAERVRRWGGTPEQIAAAWLHDAPEDTLTKNVAIIQIFGTEVGLMVAWLTRDKAEPYCLWIERMSTTEDARSALLVKFADLDDHLDRLGGLPAEEAESLGKRYRAAQARIREALGEDAPRGARTSPASPPRWPARDTTCHRVEPKPSCTSTERGSTAAR